MSAPNSTTERGIEMKLGIVISTNEAEEVWNAFRFGNVALKQNHTV
jgi:formylmethanofuran dehydrogenase subunit C